MTPAPACLTFEPFFLEGSAGRLFCLYFGAPPNVSPAANVLYVPPFAEEMNKGRRQAAIQARDLAARGFSVLIPDLFGTGDSDGEFGDARWQTWIDDLKRATDWMQRRRAAPLIVWGVRFGALLAADFLGVCETTVDRLLLWQPVISGRMHINQFLRLRIAADMIQGVQQGSTRELFGELERGRSVEIAGYELHPDLVSEIVARDLTQLDAATLPNVRWFEVVSAQDRPIPVASNRLIQRWQEAGLGLDVDVVVGEPFWSTPEIAIVTELVARTSAAAAEAAH